MVSSSEVKIACPLISFLFACLRASLGVSRTSFPLVENFIFEGSSLSIVFANLFPLLYQSIDWFGGLMSERGAISKVRSSELETGLSSSDDLVKVEEDTAVSVLWEVRAFSALGEECSLDVEILSRFSNRFQFHEMVRIRFP